MGGHRRADTRGERGRQRRRCCRLTRVLIDAQGARLARRDEAAGEGEDNVNPAGARGGSGAGRAQRRRAARRVAHADERVAAEDEELAGRGCDERDVVAEPRVCRVVAAGVRRPELRVARLQRGGGAPRMRTATLPACEQLHTWRAALGGSAVSS